MTVYQGNLLLKISIISDPHGHKVVGDSRHISFTIIVGSLGYGQRLAIDVPFIVNIVVGGSFKTLFVKEKCFNGGMKHTIGTVDERS